MIEELRIIHIITNLKMGGAERLTIDICNKLAEYKNIKVLLVLLENEIEYELPNNIQIKVLSKKCSLSMLHPNNFNNNEFETLIKHFRPNIIHSHLFEAEIISRYTIYDDIKYFTHLHDNIRQFKPKYNFTKKINITDLYERNWIYDKYVNSKNKFISISKDTTSYNLKYLPKKLRKDIIYLPNAIITKRFIPKLKTLENKIKLLSIGSLVKKKNHLFLVDVVKYLKNKNLSLELKIIGEGILKKEIETKIEKLNLTNEIRLIGKQLDINSFLNESTIYVHSAIYEPFGLVLLESMASGTPIVTLDGKGNRELITNEENGFILDNLNPSSFGDKIIQLINNKTLYNKFQNNGKEFIKKYDIDNYIKKLIKHYKS